MFIIIVSVGIRPIKQCMTPKDASNIFLGGGGLHCTVNIKQKPKDTAKSEPTHPIRYCHTSSSYW
jgi:hypothetical protein